jgi:ubiquinone/menaquinone biosynthesis C-methylase UbiE/uncharacterized protein YbaR (Trm112 family)
LATQLSQAKHTRAWWLDILACPRCTQPLEIPTCCQACGAAFSLDGDTPKLIDPSNRRDISFRFDASRSFVSETELLKVFKHPPVTLSAKELPYHVDAAHAHFLAGMQTGARVLEIGCGGGQSRQWYLKNEFEYVGTDISKTRVPELLQRHGGPDLLCDVHFLPFADRSVDLVYASAVFEHLACPILAAREIHRVLKPGGAFLGNVSFLEPWHDHSFFHLSPLGAYELLTGSGFAIECLWPGRSYSGFRAVANMSLRRGFRWIGTLGHYLYQVQSRAQSLVRAALKKPSRHPILDEAKVAGAIDWIAIKL